MRPDAKMPSYAHPGDIGLDMYAVDGATIEPGGQHHFYCGFGLEFPEGYGAIVKDKSGVSKKGLHTFGGVYDAGFRGEYNVGLINHTKEPVTIEPGQKVAQLIIFPVMLCELEEANELSDSARGEGKFGSTGDF